MFEAAAQASFSQEVIPATPPEKTPPTTLPKALVPPKPGATPAQPPNRPYSSILAALPATQQLNRTLNSLAAAKPTGNKQGKK